MKKQTVIPGMLSILDFCQVQDIPQSQVPAVRLNPFKTRFPKASDIEWKKKATLYNVEFEPDGNPEHEARYKATGEIVKQKENIAAGVLPKAVTHTIKTNFSDYIPDDVKRSTPRGKVVYTVEFTSLTLQNREVIPDADENPGTQMAN